MASKLLDNLYDLTLPINDSARVQDRASYHVPQDPCHGSPCAGAPRFPCCSNWLYVGAYATFPRFASRVGNPVLRASAGNASSCSRCSGCWQTRRRRTPGGSKRGRHSRRIGQGCSYHRRGRGWSCGYRRSRSPAARCSFCRGYQPIRRWRHAGPWCMDPSSESGVPHPGDARRNRLGGADYAVEHLDGERDLAALTGPNARTELGPDEVLVAAHGGLDSLNATDKTVRARRRDRSGRRSGSRRRRWRRPRGPPAVRAAPASGRSRRLPSHRAHGGRTPRRGLPGQPSRPGVRHRA